jgi:hypothetical protein
MLEFCDKCHGQILEGRCDCGVWMPKNKSPKHFQAMEAAILAYVEAGCNEIISGDHYTGNCIVIFKGNHQDVMKVKEFIRKLHD